MPPKTPEKPDVLFIVGYEDSTYLREAEHLILCRSCYDGLDKKTRVSRRLVPLFRVEVDADERCDYCKAPLL